VDFDANETKKAFQPDLANSWKGMASTIADHIKGLGFFKGVTVCTYIQPSIIN
jgi:hypothetical protein